MGQKSEEEAALRETLGYVMWSLRQLAHKSRAKLAKAARISEATIKLIESGRHMPRARSLARILAAIGVAPDEANEVFKLLGKQCPQHMQIELTESPLSPEGEQAGSVITIRFVLPPAKKQKEPTES